MSFLTDVFSGHFSNLGNDLAPSNIFSDTMSDAGKVLSNPYADAGIAAAIALPFLAPEIGAGLGLFGAGDAAAAGATAGGVGADLAAADAAALPAEATLDAGVIPPGIASEFALDFPTIGPGVSATGGVAGAVGSAPLDLTTFGGAGATAGSAAAPAAGTGGILSSFTNAIAPVSGALKTAAPVLGVAGLGLNLYEGQQQNKALGALSAQEAANAASAQQTAATENAAAAPLLTSGQSLMTYLQTGTLPQAFQSQVTQSVNSAKAAIIQGYASRGQNTNPEQNSALQQDLNNVDLQAQTLQASLESTLNTAGQQMVQTANQLLASGVSATTLASEIPIQVANLNANLNAQMATAISNFAAALNGSGVKPTAATPKLPTNLLNNTGGLTIQ